MNYFNYFSEIEETFVRRRGRHLLLSPLDWALMESWQEREIPLHIVLRGVEKVFDGVDREPKRKRTVKSLMYCKEEVEALYTEWLERQVGKGSETGESDESAADNSHDALFSDDAIRAHLESVSEGISLAAERVGGGLKETLERVHGRLEALGADNSTPEMLEGSLGDLEKLIDDSLLEFADKAELAKLTAEVQTNLSSYRNNMGPDVFKRTFDLMILKHLREKAQIPRLSLFYL